MAHVLVIYLAYMLPALLGTTLVVQRTIDLTHRALDLVERLETIAGRGDATVAGASQPAPPAPRAD